ncbi:amphiphysin-like isoform X2 [Brienomyrus brachyistius]|uniref:amphiphysin-like isoform X2 n=1 Tax=Brienomyrus brachyistius TaxID=42636 RepID=UPI0020B323C8|nr:amphiphysin-like isoform X2 [Brienomyrus brachyistius]
MADIKTGIFAKNVQKRLNRAQEKVLQKLGKADETKDEQFEVFVQNFKKQEAEGTRLQKEMKAYLAAIKGMQQASMNLTESLHEAYEGGWYGKDAVMAIGKDCDALWEDFHQKLVDSSLITLDTYLGQFPDIKTRIAKRSRKLIDYDSTRHHLETLQASNIKNERKISKAEEEFNKAQKVFSDLNVGLQEELPSLWDSRVGFYVNTFKNVTNLECKFHKEITVLCRQLYEVIMKLGEQHADKAFTIQGAPSDSGPLQLAGTPSPPDESPPGSPGTTSGQMLAPISPGPPQLKSPGQSRKGPPVPPPPKLTPTKEMHQEQIINLFDDNFVPEINVSAPPQNEKVSESLLDLDFDPFKPDTCLSIGQSQSPMSQMTVLAHFYTLPWDLWTADIVPSQPVSSSAFDDFSKLAISGFAKGSAQSVFDEVPAAPSAPPAVGTEEPPGPVTTLGQTQEPSTDTSTNAGDTSPPKEESANLTVVDVEETLMSEEAKPSEVPCGLFPQCNTKGLSNSEPPTLEAERESPAEAVPGPVTVEEAEEQPSPTDELTVVSEVRDENTEDVREDSQDEETMVIPSVVIEAASSNEGDDDHDAEFTTPAGISDGGEAETNSSKGDPEDTNSQSDGFQSGKGDPEDTKSQSDGLQSGKGDPEDTKSQSDGLQSGKGALEDTNSQSDGLQSGKGDPENANSQSDGLQSGKGDPESTNSQSDGLQTGKGDPKDTNSQSDGFQGLPSGFLFKVEMLHDFEAASSDELELKKGDVVLVIQTEMAAQDEGWLTGIKESAWLKEGDVACKGLFPENFTQRLQ